MSLYGCFSLDYSCRSGMLAAFHVLLCFVYAWNMVVRVGGLVPVSGAMKCNLSEDWASTTMPRCRTTHLESANDGTVVKVNVMEANSMYFYILFSVLENRDPLQCVLRQLNTVNILNTYLVLIPPTLRLPFYSRH